MKPVLIVENSTSSLIQESQNKEDYILSGTFTEFGIKNRNDRVYTAEKFLPALDEMNERIKNFGFVYGEYDHPDVFDLSLARSSHIIQKTKYVKEQNLVQGQIKLLSTHWGKEARALINDGLPIFVSSRAAGVTESDGSVSLKKLFTYDIVADPGFASAKMDVRTLNESLGYGNTNNANFRIYEMSNELKINELFNMNNNDYVTKEQLTDYSKYLVNELAKTKRDVKSALKEGKLSPKKMEELLEYYDELNNTNEKMAKYLNYLAEKVQIVVNDNKELKSTTEKLVKHNDYLAENLEKSINYTNYLAENLDKNISYSEYLAENVDKNISYSDYLAENLDKNISYSEYLAENLDKNIAYSEYIAENLDKNISYSEYLAENLDNNIAYSEYLAEHVEGNIAYSEYIAENLDDNIEYSEYIAENLDKSINYQGMITEKLNSGKINESFGGAFPTLEDAGFCDTEDEEYDTEEEVDAIEDYTDNENEIDGDVDINEVDVDECDTDEEDINEIDGDDDTELSESINRLIEEAKKRKVSESTDMNFLKFLTKSQVDSFYALTNEEQEAVKLHINESNYFSQKDVLGLISEAISAKNETLEERVLRLMPENIKPVWENLNDVSKKSLISQARLYPEENMMSEEQIDHFWNTRNIKQTNESKKLVSKTSIIQEDTISDSDAKAIMERFKNL